LVRAHGYCEGDQIRQQAARSENRVSLKALIEDVFSEWTTGEVESRLDAAQIAKAA
jgi:crotonobetainyl-CoA:carnitine CoA-transferase CaiB-like acyl-CoA transferase